MTELSIFAFQPVSVLRGPVKSRSFRLYELLRGPQGKRRSAHSALERLGRMSIFSAAVTQIMIYVLSFSIKKIRVFEGGTQNVEREVGRPAKCVGSFEDGFGEITSPLKKIISIKFLCMLAKGVNSAEFHWNKYPHCHRIPLLGAEVKLDDASYNRLQ